MEGGEVTLVGNVWSIRWHNPYTEPPAGMPRTLAEMLVPVTGGVDGAICPVEIRDYPRPRGYTVYCSALLEPLKPFTPERLARTRRQRLERRVQTKTPLFAEQFIAEDLASKPEYYAGESDRHLVDARERVLAEEQERYEYLTAHPGELLVYERQEVAS